MPAPKDDNDTGLIYMLGVAHFEQSQFEMALSEFKRLVDRRSPSTNPLKPLAHRITGRTLAKLQKEGREP